MVSVVAKRNYYDAFDGLRGIAILMVILYHIAGFNVLFEWGWLGVDLFFVLSGFLITEILLNTESKVNFFRNFYLRRAFRILPLYYFTTVLFLWLSASIPQWREQWLFYKPSLLYLFFNLHNWLVIFSSSHLKKEMFLHYWSLSVEEQYYFLWPLAIYFLKSRKKLEILLLSLLLMVILFRAGLFVWFGDSPKLFFLHFNTRIDGLLIGSLAGVYKFYYGNKVCQLIKRTTIVSLLIYSIFALVVEFSGSSFPHFVIFGYTVVSFVFSYMAVLLVYHKENVFFRLVTGSFLQLIGKISFGLYVYHWIFLVLLRPHVSQLLLRVKRDLGDLNMLSAILCIVLSFAAAMASYYFFEKPILRWKKNYY
jgi:peptidoglycan/LPS O-acetylase OafA/YrhL